MIRRRGISHVHKPREIFYSWSTGNDANSGTYASPKKGETAEIIANLQFGLVSRFKRGDTWPESILAVTTDGWSITDYGDEENPPIFDYRNSITGSWSNVGGSVWRVTLSVANLYRIWLGGVEYLDPAKRVIDAAAGATTADKVVATLAGSYLWYYDKANTNLYVYAEPGQSPAAFYSSVTGCYLKSDSSNAYPITLTGCDGFSIDGIRLVGGVRGFGTMIGGYGRISINCTDFNYTRQGLVIDGTSSTVGMALIDNPYIDPNYAADAYTASDNDDGNGAKNAGGSDLIQVKGSVTEFLVNGGQINNAFHAGIATLPESVSGTPLTITRGRVTGTEFDFPLVPYGRALAHQAESSFSGSIVFDGITVRRQPTRSQISGPNCTVRDSIWYDGKQNMGNGVPDKYDGSKTHDKLNTSQGLAFESFGVLDCSNGLIADCIIADQYDDPLRIAHYDAGSTYDSESLSIQRVRAATEKWIGSSDGNRHFLDSDASNSNTPAVELIDCKYGAELPTIRYLSAPSTLTTVAVSSYSGASGCTELTTQERAQMYAEVPQ